MIKLPRNSIEFHVADPSPDAMAVIFGGDPRAVLPRQQYVVTQTIDYPGMVQLMRWLRRGQELVGRAAVVTVNVGDQTLTVRGPIRAVQVRSGGSIDLIIHGYADAEARQ